MKEYSDLQKVFYQIILEHQEMFVLTEDKVGLSFLEINAFFFYYEFKYFLDNGKLPLTDIKRKSTMYGVQYMDFIHEFDESFLNMSNDISFYDVKDTSLILKYKGITRNLNNSIKESIKQFMINYSYRCFSLDWVFTSRMLEELIEIDLKSDSLEEVSLEEQDFLRLFASIKEIEN